jgi:hypothetical protein
MSEYPEILNRGNNGRKFDAHCVLVCSAVLCCPINQPIPASGETTAQGHSLKIEKADEGQRITIKPYVCSEPCDQVKSRAHVLGENMLGALTALHGAAHPSFYLAYVIRKIQVS